VYPGFGDFCRAIAEQLLPPHFFATHSPILPYFPMPRPIIATIDVSALQHNLAVAKSRAPHAKAWAVVKAQAYGHGLARAVRAFADADGLALVEVDYAVTLRELGWRKPILLLEGFFDADDLPLMAQHQVQFAVHCNQQIELLEAYQATLPADSEVRFEVHLKMNSGMNRLGFKPDAYRAACLAWVA